MQRVKRMSTESIFNRVDITMKSSGVTTVVAATVVQAGPDRVGGPDRPRIKQIVSQKCELLKS